MYHTISAVIPRGDVAIFASGVRGDRLLVTRAHQFLQLLVLAPTHLVRN
jgi:hypothetical protein